MNNYTGEVTFKYPTTTSRPKQVEKVEPSKTANAGEVGEKSKPWKYSLDGNISGTLGGQKKKSVQYDGKLVSQTDILKDSITLEKVSKQFKRLEQQKTTTVATSARPIQNEIKDRRLARLGIQIEPVEDSKDDEPEAKEIEEPGLDDEQQNPQDSQFHAKEGNMEISDEENSDDQGDRKERKRKKKRKEKTNKKTKSKLGMMEKWKQRQADEQTSLWNQLGI